MELNQNLADFFSNKTDSGGGGASPAPAASSGGLSSDFRGFFPDTPKAASGGKRSGVPLDPSRVESIADQENLTPAQKRMMKGLLAQESNNGANASTSVDGAMGVGQIIPGTWKRYAKAGEDPGNDDHNLAVMARIVKDLGTKFGDDPSRMATGYFSGDGNVNPGGATAWKNDARDGNGKSVSSYVSDVLKRLDGIPMPEAKAAAPAKELPDLGKAKPWEQIAKSREFRGLTPEDQAQAKAAYFDYWIAPHAGNRAQSLRSQFLGAQNPSVGMLDRAGEMLGDAKQTITDHLDLNAAVRRGQQFGSEQPLDQPITPENVVKRPGVMDNITDAARSILGLENPSVMAKGQIPNMDLPSTSKAPAETKFRDAFNAQWDAANEDQRAAMAQQPGMLGQLARDRAGRFGQQDYLTDKTQPGSMVDRVDPRVEERRQQMIRAGEDPAYAARAAKEATPYGVSPGAETGFIQTKYGSLQKSDISAAEKAIADAFSKQTGLNNPLSRGAAKAIVGTGKGIAGLYEMLYDGIDTTTGTNIAAPLAAGARTVTKASRSVDTAMGERGDFLSRNLEGAISSIGQQLPWMLKGVKTGSTVLPLIGIGLNTLGGEFSDARAAGMDYMPALGRASIFAAFETIGEFFGLGETVKAMRGAVRGMDNSEIIKLFGQALRKELPGELFTTTGEFLADKYLPGGMAMNPGATMGDYLKQVADTIAQTFMQSGVMGGATTGVGAAHRYMTGVGGVHANVAEADAQRARAEALNKAESLFGSRVTPDGRVEPTVGGGVPPDGGAPTGTVTPAEPSPLDVHPTSQTADAIVTELAGQHGVPVDTVLPPSSIPAQQQQAPAGVSPGEPAISDQDVLDWADRRYEQLLEKRDGSGLGEEAVAGAGLTPSEQQEIEVLSKAGDDASVLRTFYGLTSTTTPQENQNAQNTAQAPQSGAAPGTDASIPTGQPVGTTPVTQPDANGSVAANDPGNAERVPGQQVQGGEGGLLTAKGSYGKDKKGNDLGKWEKRYRTIKRNDGTVLLVRETTDEDGTRVDHLNQDFEWESGEPSGVIFQGFSKVGGPMEFASDADAIKEARNDVADGEITSDSTAPVKPRTEKEARQQREEKNGTQAPEAKQTEAQGSQAPAADVTAAANEAATSPQNDRPEPTKAQKEAGNYKKGHVTFDGLDLTIENPIGSTRSGTDTNGTSWSVPMTAHYGYLKRTEGADGDQVDVYLAEQPKPGSPVFVFDQHHLDTGKFDEHKVVLGASTLTEAEGIYDDHFSDGKGSRRRESVRQMTVEEFKAWAQSDEAKKPVAETTVGIPTDNFIRNKAGHWVEPRVSYQESVDDGYTTIIEGKNGNIALAKKGAKDRLVRPEDADMVRQMVAAKKPKTEKEAKQRKQEGRVPYDTVLAKKTLDFGNGKIEIIAKSAFDPNAYKELHGSDGGIINFELRGEGIASETGFQSVAGAIYSGVMTPERLDQWMLKVADDHKKPPAKPTKPAKKPKTEKEAKAKKASNQEILKAGVESGKIQVISVSDKPTVSANKIFTEDAAEKARALLKSKLKGQLNSGIDPEVMQAGITLTGYHIEKGARTFAAYAKAMIADLGEAVKPYLKSWYMAVKFDPRAVELAKEMDPTGEVEKADLEKVLAGDSAEGAPVANGKLDLTTPEGRYEVAKQISEHFFAGKGFPSIIAARKHIEQITGQKINPGTEAAKLADEAVEAGVVIAARDIVYASRRQGRSPQMIYERLMSLYDRQPNLAVRSSTSIREQAYSTPIPLAFVASELAGITDTSTVYEPTAGNGMLLVAANPSRVVANELNPRRFSMLQSILGDKATVTMDNAAYYAPEGKYGAVIANPPFGVTKNAEGETLIYEVAPDYGTREVDHAIAFKALETMKDAGRAVLIVGGVQAEGEEPRREDYRAKSKRSFYTRLYQDYNVVDHFSIAGDMYSKQGASYPVDVIVIQGRGKSSRDLPAAELPRIINSYEELKEKLNGTDRVDSTGDNSRDGTDRSADQPGSRDGNDVAGSPGRSDGGNGTQGTRPGSSSGTGVPSTRAEPTGQRAPTGAVSGNGKSPATGVAKRSDDGRGSVPGNGEQQRPASAASDRGNDTSGLGEHGSLNGERVGSELKDRRGQEQETETQVEYIPFSKAASVGTLVPRAMRDSIAESLQRVETEVGDIDQYVADALGMPVKKAHEVFSAEQIDALALAIKNAQDGLGFIIGDQTGIGKGRVVAAMIRYALVSGKTPIFVTEKPNLYADMIRDLDDIDMTADLRLDTKNPAILMTNADKTIPYVLLRKGSDGQFVENNFNLKFPKGGKPDALMKQMQDGNSLGDYKVIFTTYSQLQTVKGKATERQRLISHFANGNYVIFDESHNAGGTGGEPTKARSSEQREAEGSSEHTGRAGFARNLVNKAYGTFFSSATYAKRPDVMDLYSSTNMKLAVDRISQLAEAIKRGGVPMQQVVANMLTQDGQYIRRERTFAGVSYDTKETKVDKQTAENMATSMHRILQFSRAKELAVSAIQKELDKEGKIAGTTGERTTVQGANFGSIMHNLIDQMLLALKVQDSVRYTIERLKAGEKVVLTVSNTMGSFLKDYADEMGLNNGDPIALSFKDLYIRYLEKQRVISIKAANGMVTKHRLSDEELGPGLTAMFNQVRDQISEAGFGSAPISPIDYMRSELEKAGYRTDEITGRTVSVKYSVGTPTLSSRNSDIRQRLKAVRGFNNGDVDVLILNQAGSTGLSLHASEKVKDKRKRHMIIVQPEKNIDTHMQMLGRVHRTGQVIAPAYSQMMADIPAEMRPAAVLLKKMASLSANTTASRKSAVTAEGVVDFMNDYGGIVTAEYLRDNQDVHGDVGGNKVIPLFEEDEQNNEDLIRKFTGYIPILPIAKQEEVYRDLTERYNELIERENSMGTNKLEAKAVDLDAETISSKVITEEHKDKTSIFAQPATMERVDVKRTVKPMTSMEVNGLVEDRLGDKTASQTKREMLQELHENGRKFITDKMAEIEQHEKDAVKLQQIRDTLEAIYNRAESVLRTYTIGDPVTVKMDNGLFVHGVIIDMAHAGRTENPAAGSAWKMTIALADGDAKTLKINFGQIGSRYSLAVEEKVDWYNPETQQGEYTTIRSLFDKGGRLAREKRWMVTGNLLAGFAKHFGQIISYTKKDGTVAQGVLMSRQFDFDKEHKNAPVRLKTPDAAMKFLTEGGYGALIGTEDKNIRVSYQGGRFNFITPSSKKDGGRFFLDTKLTDAIGSEFYKRGSLMQANTRNEHEARAAIDYLIRNAEDPLYALTNLEKARDMVGGEGGVLNNTRRNQTDTPEFKGWFKKSAVVDYDGKPQRMYHATYSGGFDTFDRLHSTNWRQPSMDTVGSWFSDNPSNDGGAGMYANSDGASIYPVYLSIQRPKVYTTFDDFLRDMHEAEGRDFETQNPKGIGSTEGLRAKLKAQGYDGIAFQKTDNAELIQEVKEWSDSLRAARLEEARAPKDQREAYTMKRERIENTLKQKRAELAATNGSTEFDKQYVWIAFDDTQIKSAIGNNGKYSQTNGSIVEDIGRSPAAGMTSLSEPQRGTAATRLTKLQDKLDAGKMTEAEFLLAVRMLTEDLKDKADQKKYDEILRARRRGADWVISRLYRGVADGQVPQAEVDFAQWLLEQNPSLGNDLGVSIKEPKDRSVAGNYNPVSKVMTILKGQTEGDTAVHEILHHTERMMPTDVQNGIVTEWQKAWDAAYKKASPKLKQAMIDMLAAAYGNQAAADKVRTAFGNGTLKYADHYQLYSPSEFWAVNGSRILSDRHAASKSWVKRAIQWLKEFIERAKGAFGLRSDAPVLKGLKNVLTGDGTMKNGSRMLVEHDVSGFLREIEQDEKPEPYKQEPHEFNNIVRRTQRNVMNHFANQPANLRTFGIYDKTLATQFHKALKDKDYGKVFGYANAMQNEISLTAIRPAELAPAVLPKIDNVVAAAKTVLKGKKSHPQMEAAANALFAGTLYGNTVLDGHVWSDSELRNNFRLNDEGVELYRQSRAAIDASLDEIAAAEAYAAAQGFIPRSMRRQIIDNPQAARTLIEAELAKQTRTIKAAIRAAAGNQQRIDDLNASLTGYEDAEKAINRIFTQSKLLKDAGYAPLMRFGAYSVTVQPIDPATGMTLKDQDGNPITEFFGQYETQAEARMIERQQQQLYAGQDYRVTAGVKSELSHRLYAGITPETLALFGDVIGIDAATKKYYQVALAERSALKRRLQRKNVSGYTDDMPRVLSNFITSNGRLAAQRYYQKDFDQAIRKIPNAKGDVMDEAIKLKEYLNNPKDPAAPVSAALFAWFLGGSVASAAVNLTQPILMTAPYLSQFGIGKATKALGEAMPIALGKKPVNDPVLRDMLKRASREGVVDAQEIFHLYSVGTQSVSTGLVNALSHIPVAGKYVKAGSDDARTRVNAFLTIWGSMFSAADGFNRRLTFVAAWKVAKANGKNDTQAYAFAVRAVNETQGIYNKVNRPNWARNPVGRVILTFKQYAIMYVELLSRLWKNGGPEGKRAALIMLAVLMLSAGEDNLPFSQDLDDMIDTIGQLMGFDTNVRRSKRRLAHQILGKGLGDLFLYGLSSQLPIDFSNRLGLGNLIPATDAGKLSNTNPGRSLWEIGGAGVGLGQQVGDAFGAWGEGNIAKGFKNLAPTAVRNAIEGADMVRKGQATDFKGRKTVETTPGEGVGKMIGFNPTVVAQETRKTMPVQQDINLQRHMESSILDNWARAASERDDAGIAKQKARLAEWNKDNPEIPIVIHPEQIRNRVKMMGKDKDTRLLKSAPREIRGRIGLELIK